MEVCAGGLWALAVNLAWLRSAALTWQEKNWNDSETMKRTARNARRGKVPGAGAARLVAHRRTVAVSGRANVSQSRLVSYRGISPACELMGRFCWSWEI